MHATEKFVSPPLFFQDHWSTFDLLGKLERGKNWPLFL